MSYLSPNPSAQGIFITPNSRLKIGKGTPTEQLSCQSLIRPSTKNLTGQKFGHLTVLSFNSYKSGNALWLCRCYCGVEKVMSASNITSGRAISCGCNKRKRIIKYSTTHGLSKHPLHGVWSNIKERCYNPNNPSFDNYGARGVKMCELWLNNFKSFYDWCMSNGWQKGLEIDKDIKGNGMLYSPEMCSIVQRFDNANKKRNNWYLTKNGETKSISQWAKELGLSRKLIHDRKKVGWTDERALIPKLKEFKGNQYNN